RTRLSLPTRRSSDLPAALEQHGAQLRVVGAIADVPLAGRDDLERARAPLVELHRVRDRRGLSFEAPRVPQEVDHARPRLLDGLRSEEHTSELQSLAY